MTSIKRGDKPLWDFIDEEFGGNQHTYINLKDYYTAERQLGSGRNKGDIAYMIVSMLVACDLNGERGRRLDPEEEEEREELRTLRAVASAVLAAALIRLPSHSTLQGLYRSLSARGKAAALAELRGTLALRTEIFKPTRGLVLHGFNRAGSAWRGGSGEQAYKTQITQEYEKLWGWLIAVDSLLGFSRLNGFREFRGPQNPRVRNAFIRYFGDPDAIYSPVNFRGRHGFAANVDRDLNGRRGNLKMPSSAVAVRAVRGGFRAMDLVGNHVVSLREAYFGDIHRLNIHFSGMGMTPENFVEAKAPTAMNFEANLQVTERFFDSFDETSRLCYMVAAMIIAAPPNLDFALDQKTSKDECLDLARMEPHRAICNAHNYAFFLCEVFDAKKEPSSLWKWLWRC